MDISRTAIDHADAERGALISRMLLARAIQLIVSLTPRNKIPTALSRAVFSTNEPHLFEMAKVLSTLEKANSPKKAGRKSKRLNFLASLTQKPRGRKADHSIEADQQLVQSFEAEQFQLSPDDKKKSMRKVCDEVALRVSRQAANAERRTTSAADLRRAKTLGETLNKEYARAKGRIRKRRNRETNTQK